MGFSYELNLACEAWNWSYRRYNSKHVEKQNGSSNKGFFQINVKTVICAFEGKRICFTWRGKWENIGDVLAEKKVTLSWLTNSDMVNPEKLDHLHLVYYFTVPLNATKDTHEKLLSKTHVHNSKDQSVDCTVPGDGAWSKKGHSSIYELVKLISKENGKCIESYIMSKKCKGCSMWAKKKNFPEYQEWLANHVCQANHSGSFGSMEPTGIANAIQTFNY